MPHSLRLFTLASIVAWLTVVQPLQCATSANPGETVAKHLQSLGSIENLKTVKSRVIEGGATYRVLVGGSGAIDGKAALVSEGPKSHILFKINANGFNGEQFVCDGQHSSVAATYNDKSRSELGEFIRTQDVVLREGLLGGELSTAWPLLDLDARGAKLTAEGFRKMDGKEVVALRYRPKKGSDLEIMLYFDPETSHHVMTTYTTSIRAGIGIGGELDSVRQQETRYRLEERFSDFKTVDGFTLPQHYDLRYTQESKNGFTKSVEWEVAAKRVLNNISLDARNFEVK